MEPVKHIDAYPWDCPACIFDKRPAGDEALSSEHGVEVRRIRALKNPSEAAKRLRERPRS